MPRYVIRDFGGWWNGDPTLAVPEGTARTAYNIRFDPIGLARQYGTQRMVPDRLLEGGNPQPILSIYDYQDGVDQHVLAVSGTKLLEMSDWPGDPSTNSWIELWTDLPLDSTTGFAHRMAFQTAFGRCYFQNGLMDGLVYDGPQSTLPGSPKVYYWGIDGPLVAVKTGGTSGELPGGVGNFEDFEIKRFFFDGPTPDHPGVPRNHDVPEGWTNINKTRSDKSTDGFSGDSSVELFSGRIDGGDFANGAAAGGTPFDHFDSAMWTSKPYPTMANGYDVYFQIDQDDFQEALNWFPQYFKEGVLKIKENAYTIDDADLLYYWIWTPYGNLDIPYYGFKLTAPPTAISGGTANWRFYRGPEDGVLRRQVDITEVNWASSIDVTARCAFKRLPISTDYAEVQISLIETYEDSFLVTQTNTQTTSIAEGSILGQNEWNSDALEVSISLVGNTGGNLGTTNLEVELRVVDHSTESTLADPKEFSARFDEIRIVEGSIAPVSGGALAGIYRYTAVFVDEEDGTFSPPAPFSDSLDVSGGFISVTDIPQPNVTLPNHTVSHIYLYRSRSDDGETYGPSYFVGKVEVGVTTYDDNMPEAIAIENDILISDVIHPPRGQYCIMFEGRMVVAGRYDDNFPYTTGTVSVNNGSATVTGSGTSWTDIMAGLDFTVGTEEITYRIQEVVSTTEILLTTDYQGTNQVGASYTIGKDSRRRNGRTLYYSEVNQPGVFRETNYLELDTRDNDQITGIGVNGGRLWAFTRDSVWEITHLGDNFERASMRHNGIGAETGYSITQYEGLLFFPARDGFYAMDAGGNLENLTDAIDLSWNRSVDFDKFQVAAVQEMKLWLNSFDIAWTRDMRMKKWSAFFQGHRMWTVGAVDTSNDRDLVFGDEDGYFYRMDEDYLRYGNNVGTLGGSISAADGNSITVNSGLFTVGDGLNSQFVQVRRYDAKGNVTHVDWKKIGSNTGNKITLDDEVFWDDRTGEADGTVTVANGSPTVTGSGTSWTSALVGEGFYVDGDTDWYEIQSVDSPTQITLTANYTGTGGAGQAYAFISIPVAGTDDWITGTISNLWWSNWLDFGDAGLKKKLKRMKISVYNSATNKSFTVGYDFDERNIRYAYTTLTDDTSPNNMPWMATPGRGYLLSIGITNWPLESEAYIHHLEAEWEPKGNKI